MFTMQTVNHNVSFREELGGEWGTLTGIVYFAKTAAEKQR